MLGIAALAHEGLPAIYVPHASSAAQSVPATPSIPSQRETAKTPKQLSNVTGQGGEKRHKQLARKPWY